MIKGTGAVPDIVIQQATKKLAESSAHDTMPFILAHPDAVDMARSHAEQNQQKVAAIARQIIEARAAEREQRIRRGDRPKGVYECYPFTNYPVDHPVDSTATTKEPLVMTNTSSSFDLGNFFRQKLTSSSNSDKHVHTGVYTGVLEKYEEGAELLVLAMHKGKPVAILANQQILPFEVITVSDAMAKAYGQDYDKNRQGRILHVKGERPKAR